MKRLQKLSGMMLAVILLFSLLSVNAAAANREILQFTNYPQENIAFSIDDETFSVQNLPNSSKFRSVWLIIVDQNNRQLVDKVLSRKTDGSVSTSLRNLKDGDYFVELYFSAGGDDYASYVFGDDVVMRVENGAAFFVDSPTLAHNENAFAAGRTDNAALAYYLVPEEYVQSDSAEIVALANELTGGISGDYEKALAIHDWVCKNIWYDNDAVKSGTLPPPDALYALQNRRAVCAGYASLSTALLRASEIPAKLVVGYGMDAMETGGWTESMLSGREANHSWVEAYVDGRWIMIDATYNCGNNYQDGRKASSDGVYSYRYFDAAMEAFSMDHFILHYFELFIPPSDNPSNWAAAQIDAAISEELVPRTLRVSYAEPITRAEFCALAVRLYETMTGGVITARQSFLDTDDINVQKAAAIGIVGGTGNNYFSPGNALTREAAATILARLADAVGTPLPKQAAAFSDSGSIASWALEAVGQVQAGGIMGGVGNNSFSPIEPYTREQSIVTILRLFQLAEAA